MIELPKSRWKRPSLNCYYSLLAVALTDIEIRHISDFYGGLDNIESIYLSLLSLAEKDENDFIFLRRKYGNFIPHGESLPKAFKTKAPLLFTEFEKISLNLIKTGNPLDLIHLWESYELND